MRKNIGLELAGISLIAGCIEPKTEYRKSFYEPEMEHRQKIEEETYKISPFEKSWEISQYVFPPLIFIGASVHYIDMCLKELEKPK